MVCHLVAPSARPARLNDWGVPHVSLGYRRGRAAAIHPRDVHAALAATGRDGAVVGSAGWLPALVRLGGYRAPLLGVEHGELTGFGLAPDGIWRGVTSANRSVQLRLGRAQLDAVVAVSRAVRQKLLTRHVPAHMIKTIPCGVDLRTYRYVGAHAANGRQLRVVSVSRLIPGKGLNHLLWAVARIWPDVPVLLDIWGSGTEQGELTEMADRLGLASAVHLRGTAMRPANAFADADVVVVPSAEWVESFGRTAVEAMACGKPVIATNSGGLPDIVADGHTGILVEPRSASALASALVHYYRDPELRARHGAAGRLRVQAAFDVDRCAHQYLALIASCS
ncbi:MAG: glycosyltransferase family 4 protein [Mycobacterium sp.]